MTRHQLQLLNARKKYSQRECDSAYIEERIPAGGFACVILLIFSFASDLKRAFNNDG